jgi:hypothetical protein
VLSSLYVIKGCLAAIVSAFSCFVWFVLDLVCVCVESFFKQKSLLLRALGVLGAARFFVVIMIISLVVLRRQLGACLLFFLVFVAKR